MVEQYRISGEMLPGIATVTTHCLLHPARFAAVIACNVLDVVS